MKLFELIQLREPNINPQSAKVHLACWNGHNHPIDIFFDGKFEEWQSWQTSRNFGRPFIVSLIDLGWGRWLFGGAYRSLACSDEKQGNCYKYTTELMPETEEFTGRVVVDFKRSGRNSYRKAETISDQLEVVEMKSERLTFQDFSGYFKVLLTKSELDRIVRQQIPSWKAGLSHVAGVYLITDNSDGRLYVGSATGTQGLWARWSAYSADGHGGNTELRALLKEKGREHAQNFQYSVLEIADTHASVEDVRARETHWKNVLRSREFGLNGN